MLTRLAAAVAVIVACLVLPTAPASAEDCPAGTTPAPGGGVICVVVTDPGTPGDPGDNETIPAGVGGGCHRADGSRVACVTEWGTWNSAHQCRATGVDLPSNGPGWRGHRGGSVWMCNLIGPSKPVVTWWVPPDAGAPAPVDPGVLAQRAVGLLPLATAEVHTAPQSPDRSFVGVENWLWVPQPQWATLTKSVSAGGTSVTVTARPERVVWDMGPTTTTCYSAGREWRAGMTDAAQTTCGYTYKVTSTSQPDGAFGVSARIQYQVDWTCSGVCTSNTGTLGLIDAPAGSGSLQVLQRQTVVVR